MNSNPRLDEPDATSTPTGGDGHGAFGADPVGDQLGLVATSLARRDRTMGQVAAALVGLQQADGLHERLGGMTLQVWLQHVCRLPGGEARRLMACIDVLTHLPSVVAGLADGWLSWPQAAGICRAGRKLRVARLAELDDLVAAAMPDAVGFEPDALVDDVWQWVDHQQPTRLERAEAAAERGEFVSLAPRLFGGGSMYAELGTVGFAAVAEYLDHGRRLSPIEPTDVADLPDGSDVADGSEGLVDAHPSGPNEETVLTSDDLADMDAGTVEGLLDTLDEHRRSADRHRGADRARRLVDLCAHALAGSTPSHTGGLSRDLENSGGNSPVGSGANPREADLTPGFAGDGWSGRTARPLLVATITADALLDADRTPGWLLHTLAGGRMKVSARLLQQLVDERGTDLRGVVLDDCGQVVGVGRRTHVPPGWLREAIWARDTAVQDPAGACPVRRADLDHVTPWPAGPTDVDNLNPVGRPWHNHKTSKAWTVTRAADGTTTWRHRRHGWTIRLAPAARSLTSPARHPDNPGSPDTDPSTTDRSPPPRDRAAGTDPVPDSRSAPGSGPRGDEPLGEAHSRPPPAAAESRRSHARLPKLNGVP